MQIIGPDLVKLILDQLPIEVDGIHGVLHWARVLTNGRYLCQHTSARQDVVEYFSLLHDSRRFSNGGDFLHGPRAARFAASLRDPWISLDDAGFKLLQTAIHGHTQGGCGADITVQACWDSDRLDLGRAGITPVPHRLCTLPAREPAAIELATQRAVRNWVAVDVLAEWGIDWPV
jgi:uncharacterized protein